MVSFAGVPTERLLDKYGETFSWYLYVKIEKKTEMINYEEYVQFKYTCGNLREKTFICELEQNVIS